jgi:superfamily II DNA or RNA helicase
MKLPSVLELKRLGHAALKRGLDPSALERGLQYLRDGGFERIELSVMGAKGLALEFTLKEPCDTRIEFTTPSQSLYSSCGCSMSGYGIFCKHQAIGTWVISILITQDYDLTRVDESVKDHIRQFEPIIQKLKANTPSTGDTPSNTTSTGHSGKHFQGGNRSAFTPTDVELTGLIFSFPELAITELAQELPTASILPAKSVGQNLLMNDLAVPFHRESDLPHPLWRSPLAFRGTTHTIFQSNFEVSKRKCIVYLFSNGVQVPISEILFHQYAGLIPSELIPTTSNINENFLQKLPLRYFPKEIGETVSKVAWDIQAEAKLDSVLISVAIEAGKHFQRERLKCYLSTPELLDQQNRAIELTSLHFIPPGDVHSGYQIESAQNTSAAGFFELKTRIQVERAPEPWIYFKTFAFNPKTSAVFFHLDHHWMNHYPADVILPNHGSASDVLEQLQVEFHAKPHDLKTKPPFQYTSLESPGFQSSVRVFSNGTFAVNLDFGHTWIDGFPLEILRILQTLSLGLRAQDEKGVEELFSNKRQAKRATDLRLLRHMGVATLIFQESVRYFMKRNLPFDRFFEALKIKVAQLLNKLEGSPTVQHLTLELYCSKPAIEFMERWVRHLDRLDQERLFPLIVSQHNLWVAGVYRFYLKLIYSWVTTQQIASQATAGAVSVLLKTKDGVISNPVFETLDQIRDLRACSAEAWPNCRNESSKWIFSHKESTPDALIRAFLPLQIEGVLLSLNDQPIEELDDTDFVSEFILEETTDQHGRIDWFELHPKFFFKGVEIAEEQAKALSATGMITFQGKIYRLNQTSIPSLDKLSEFWDQLAKSQSPKRGSKRADRIYRLPKHYTLELLALRSTGVRVRGGPIWDRICVFYDSLNQEREPFMIPASFKGELKPYQMRGVQWIDDLYQLGLGGILADDMGLGKTVQTLVFLELLRLRNELGHSLIVVPTSLTYNWMNEAKKFTTDLPIQIFQSKEMSEAVRFLEESPQGILIATYGLLAEHEAFFSNYRWNLHIYDEAQNLKTITAKRTTVSRKIPARFKLALTGTPLENHMGEFYSLMDLVVPGSLGAFDQFRKSYMQSYSPDPERIQYLKLKTKPLVLRRTKAALLKELPSKTESTIKIPFSEKQLAIYRDIALSWNNRVRQAVTEGGESKSQLIMLTALLRLRQVCSAPACVPNVSYTETPPKISLLVDNLKSIIETGESALVFTQFLGTFDLIAKELKKAGIPYYSLHGKVSRKDREIQLQKFHDEPGGAVMLMTLKTGGVGLNLTKASYVFHLEPWWNPAVENQATDRTHRIGQTRPVQVYRYIMSESVEEKIEILKSRKSSQFNALFSDIEADPELTAAANTGSVHLTQKDFEYLLGI